MLRNEVEIIIDRPPSLPRRWPPCILALCKNRCEKLILLEVLCCKFGARPFVLSILLSFVRSFIHLLLHSPLMQGARS